jgi:hypothetical protein
MFALAQSAPVPFISQPLVPGTVLPGSAGFTLTINGSGFTTNSAVYWNGSLRAATFVSANQIQAQIYASDVASAGFGWVTVSNQGIGSVFSNVGYVGIGAKSAGVGFQPEPIDVTNPGQVAVGDFNNDGILDFVTTFENGTKKGMEVFLGKGDGTFQRPVITITEPISQMLVGDFNGDGNLDVAAIAEFGCCVSNLHVFLGNGNGTFSEPIFGYGLGTLLYTADFNNDGMLDLLVLVRDGCCGDSGYEVWLGNGNGSFQSNGYLNRPAIGSVTVGDFNGDGYLDFATSGYNKGDKGELYVYLNDGSGRFTVNHMPMRYPGQVAAADVNGDGIIDIVSSGVSVMLGKGDGTFYDYFSIEGPQQAGSISIADFNDDGKLDIAAGPSLLLGHGNGTFAAAVSFADMFPGQPSIMGPFNPDGAMDLIGINGTGGQLTLFKSVPAYFQPASIAFGQQPIGITSAAQTATLTNYSRAPVP